MTDRTVVTITQMLEAVREGDEDVINQLEEVLYPELRRIARAQMAHEAQKGSKDPTSLAHDCILRLRHDALFEEAPNRRYLFVAAARAMRRILIEEVRRNGAIKRGGQWTRVPFDCIDEIPIRHDEWLPLLDEALTELSHHHPRQAAGVEMRYFGGLPNAQIAKVLRVSLKTVEADLRYARAWLGKQIKSASAK